ncbi:PTS sugar transporter subunit IIA [Glaciihabitans sp. dw_435]|uniref:PTS sugar transporter subunit IIA n=1 Tax=Glaciihabitans sp. dw_435 TaxID=2720081 RepID=UPI001BD61D46|nr:PTS sugar transporter subunit IIA [Glaciihabitans sp. dw_435]
MAALSSDRLRDLLPPSSIVFAATAVDADDAIRQTGAVLVSANAVAPHYVDAMLEREASVSTFVGDGIAMPHGTLTAKDDVEAEGLALMLLADPIDWNGDEVSIVIAIAARGRRYIALISQLAAVLLDADRAAALRAAITADDVYAVFDAA